MNRILNYFWDSYWGEWDAEKILVVLLCFPMLGGLIIVGIAASMIIFS